MPSGKKSLLLALMLGLLAGLATWSAIDGQQRKVQDDWKTVKVLCAARDVPEGAELTRPMVAVREVPARFLTGSYVEVEQDGSVKNDPVGQRVLVPLKAGDPVLVSHFAPARDADLSTMVHPKGRAVTVDVQERNAVGLWVRPNDHVDVVGSFRDPQTQQLKSVTLLVLPEEAEILTLAQETGTLTLLLRNPDDLDSQDKRAVVDQRQLLTGERAGELQQKRYRTIQIIRGARSGAAGAVSRED